jgi:Zn-dependent M28 family amino/carboxypeptidase
MLKNNNRIKVKLRLDTSKMPDVETANVVGEIVGSELPNEIVVIGGHLDSWDVGTGAHDDAAGCSHVLEAARLIQTLGLKPKRTIRVVLFANEENGLRGGKAYAEAVRPENEKHIAAIESDAGGFSPLGFSVNSTPELIEKIQAFAPLLKATGAVNIMKGFGGADLLDLSKKGIPTIALRPDSQRYFDYHHSQKDTLDKVNPRELQLGAISVAILSYAIAEQGV